MKNERSERISKLLQSQKSRAAYIKAKLSILVPAQIRTLRRKSTNPPMLYQRDLARQAEMQQSRISMFETPGMANMTLETLSKVAAALKVGLIVEFVPFSDMLRWENNFSPDFDVTRLEKDDEFLHPAMQIEDVPLRGGASQPVTNISASSATIALNAGDTSRKPVASAQARSVGNQMAQEAYS